MGLRAFLLVLKSVFFGGIDDTHLGDVLLISNPTLNPEIIFSYLVGIKNGGWNVLGIASVDNLEDVIRRHIWIGCILIVDGI